MIYEEPLVKPEDLADFPGAPFPAGLVKAISGAIRDAAGWHIAPRIAETRVLRSYKNRMVLLPSLHVEEVTSVEDVATGDSLTGWTLDGPVLHNDDGRWPERVRVTFEHGYRTCPPGLLLHIAQRCQKGAAGMVEQESILGRSVKLASTYDAEAASVISAYTLASRP